MSAPSEDALPMVSCVIAAYNHARYLPHAVRSALDQDYPASRLEVVVVDDGSTDETPQVLAELAERHLGRVRWTSQRNAGYIAATSAAMSMACGDLVAILDADDMWLEHKTRAQVNVLTQNPRVGLVYGDMGYIDADGLPLDPSVWRRHDMTPLRGRPVAELCRRNFGLAGTIMVRRDALHLFHPYPPEREAPYQDWWTTARVATGWDIDYIDGPCALYRRHDANMTDDGADPASEARDLHREARMIRTLVERHIDLIEAHDATAAIDAHDRKLLAAGQLAPPACPDVSNQEAARAEQHAQRALGLCHDDPTGAVKAAVCAVACDPVAELPRAALAAATDAAARRHAAAPAASPGPPTADDQRGAVSDPPRSFVVLCAATDASDDLLSAVCSEFDGGDDVTLVVAFDDATPGALEPAARSLDRLKSATPLDARAIPISQLDGVMCHARVVADDRAADGEMRFGPGMMRDLRARYEAQQAADDGPASAPSGPSGPAATAGGSSSRVESDDYTDAYFDTLVEGSARSAGVVLPKVFDLVGRPGSVVDVGCGTGPWAATAKHLGCAAVLGVDGDYVDRERLLVDASEFVTADLDRPLRLGRRFDLAISMEVAEHIEPASADLFVASLCDLSDVVLFSAAIPNQGGQRHINEQWPEYWAALFARRGYACCDAIRDSVWNDQAVAWWYAQNALLFVKAARLEQLDRLHATVKRPGIDRVGMVHPDAWDHYRPWRGMAQFAKPWPQRV